MTSEVETLGMKRIIWCLARQAGGETRVLMSTMNELQPLAAVTTFMAPDGLSLVIIADMGGEE